MDSVRALSAALTSPSLFERRIGDVCAALFRLEEVSARLDGPLPPRPLVFNGPPPAVGRQGLPTRLLVGTESQFHRWGAFVREELALRAFGFGSGLRSQRWARHFDALADLVRQFFRYDRGYPALAWASPVWIRNHNAFRRAGLLEDDRALGFRPFGWTSADRGAIPLRFPNGESLGVDANRLWFYYPNRAKRLLRCSRMRRVLRPERDWASSGFEEGLNLVDDDGEDAIKRGAYPPNALHARREAGVDYLEFFALTLARLYPVASLLRAAGCASSTFLRIAPEQAWASFLRLTFHPESMRVVVLLAAERDFPRFVAEHPGLLDVLDGAFPGRGG